MKTIAFSRDFSYCPSRWVTIQYRGGFTYQRVPEAAVRVIRAAEAGEILQNGEETEPERRAVQETDEGLAEGNS
jgi:hypothetical protein